MTPNQTIIMNDAWHESKEMTECKNTSVINLIVYFNKVRRDMFKNWLHSIHNARSSQPNCDTQL